MKKLLTYSMLVSLSALSACEKTLEVTPKSEFSPANVLASESGIRSLLFSAYAQEQAQTGSRNVINNSEVCTDMGFNTGGAENARLVTIVNFTWDPSIDSFSGDMWNPNYRSIRDANGVIGNIDNVAASDAVKKLYRAEARALRGQAYAALYNFFGPVPLRTAANQTGSLARATEEETRAFIEADLMQAIPDLPDPGKEEAYGRMNKGIAGGLLAKYYLNTRQWQKAADAAKAVIDFNYYVLNPDFVALFRVENEGSSNREMMLVLQCRPEDPFGNWYMAGAFPPGFKGSSQFPDFVYKPTMSNFATQYRLRTAFTNSFDPRDKRLKLICTSYVNNSNQTIDLSTGDQARSFKYWDNNTVGNNGGTDVPILRYSDILLTRAEALNEISGPLPECFVLINAVRTRAGLSNLTLADTPTKETFRAAIFRERGWEFVSEGKRREDLLRQGTFISGALARGITNAKPERAVFPVPQAEVDANLLLKQSPGY